METTGQVDHRRHEPTRPFTTALLRLELERWLRIFDERLLQARGDDDLAQARRRRIRRERDRVTAALTRIADGTFGVCLACGGAVSEDRLEAMPLTQVCAGCLKPDMMRRTAHAGRISP